MAGSPGENGSLRVMHFVGYYPPERIGGVGEFAKALHQGLLRRGHDSVVVTSGGAGSDDRLHRIARTRLGWFLGTLRWAGRAAACDVVHCQSGEALPVLLALALRRGRRARSLVTFHAASRGIRGAAAPYTLAGRRFGPGPLGRVAGALRGLLHGAVDALALRLADGCNAICRATAADLGHPDLAVIYNGVAAGQTTPAPEGPEILYVGLPTHGKRVLALPFTLQAVRRELPGTRLRLVGFEWQQAPELRALFDELGLAQAVECLGRRRREELPALYFAARVLIVPSAYEALPYVILEAMQQGTPVVATRVGGHSEVIDAGENGLLVPADDPEALAAGCVALLGDAEQARRLAAAARETLAQRFELERCIDEYVHYYRALARGET